MPYSKYITSLIFSLMIGLGSYAQDTSGSDSIGATRDTLAPSWLVEQKGRVKHMRLLSSLGHDNFTKDSILINLERSLNENLPGVMTFRLPAGVDHERGLFLYFGKEEINESQETEMLLTSDPILLDYNACDEAYCEVRLFNLEETQDEPDLSAILAMFLQYDAVFFIITYPNDEVLSSKVLLSGFKIGMEELLDNSSEEMVQELEKD